MSAAATPHARNHALDNRLVSFLQVMVATSRMYSLQHASNVIQLIRGPVTPVLNFLAFWLVYRISDQSAVPESQVTGFLVISSLATLAWTATVWACGFGLQAEAYNGTLVAVFTSPANRIALVCGYGIGNIVMWSATGMTTVLVVGFLLDAQFDIANVGMAALTLLLVYASALSIGIACGGLFILSRNANSLANFLQTPIYLLSGFFFPRSVLPDWLEPVSTVLPIAHATDALRAATLAGATWNDVQGDILATTLGCAGFVVLGVLSMKRVEYAIRNSGSLNLF